MRTNLDTPHEEMKVKILYYFRTHARFYASGDPYSTYDRKGGGVVVQISMKAYLGGRGSAISVHTFLKPKKGPVCYARK